MFDHLAVVGATGAVGRIVLQLIAERDLRYKSIRFLASARSAGTTIVFKNKQHVVEELRRDAFKGIDLVIASTPDEVAAEFAPWAVEQGAVVVDESGYWRMKPHVPLVVPEVNPEAVEQHQGIIASPNCSTTQMVVALKPLHDAARVKRVVVSTYQATSGAGVSGQSDLTQGSRAALAGQPFRYSTFKHPIAFNLIPQIGSPKHQGYTSEEMKMVWETRKILGDDTINICPTCVRVPVTNCHSESILVETERKLSVEEARESFANFPGITVIDDLDAGQYPMPLECSGKDDVFIGRIREDMSCDNGLAFWCVSDNLRKGAATNAVQIAELLMKGVKVPSEMQKRTLRLTLAYDGSEFFGWQYQTDRRTVQAVLESAIQNVTGESLRVVAAGRTDAGVHALGQTVSLETESRLDNSTFLRAINAHLPPDVSLLDVADAPHGFNAIDNSSGKRYRYLIQDNRQRNVFFRRHAWWVTQPLDLGAMCQAVAGLTGTHDYRSFENQGSPPVSTVRTVRHLSVERSNYWPGELVVVEIEADGFLYNMVRNIVGTLVEVAKGKQLPDWPAGVLAARNRKVAGMCAPPHGLYLVKVYY